MKKTITLLVSVIALHITLMSYGASPELDTWNRNHFNRAEALDQKKMNLLMNYTWVCKNYGVGDDQAFAEQNITFRGMKEAENTAKGLIWNAYAARADGKKITTTFTLRESYGGFLIEASIDKNDASGVYKMPSAIHANAVVTTYSMCDRDQWIGEPSEKPTPPGMLGFVPPVISVLRSTVTVFVPR